MLPISSGDKFLKTASKIRKRKTNSLSCVHFLTFPTKGIFAWAFSRRRSRAATAKKCTKKRDARAESLFCVINLLLFCRFRCLSYLLGTLRCNDADGKKNVKKTIGFISKTTSLHVHHAFLYISLPVFAQLRRKNA